jgi:hypothetical protein
MTVLSDEDEKGMPTSPSDQTLVRYVLGGLTDEESERLDQLSVVDDEFSARLRGIEHDLADAYVRGRLSARDREQWERQYLASEHGRHDLRMAQTLLARERRPSAPPYRATFTWGLAAAAALLIVSVVAYFAVVHRSMPAPVSASIAPAAGETPARPATALRVVALTLSPMTRSLGEPPTLEVPGGTDQVRLILRLEPNEFDRYDVAVKDLAANGIVWRASDVTATSSADTRALVVSIPASTFRSRRYLVTVSGARLRNGEIIGTYPLQMVVQ